MTTKKTMVGLLIPIVASLALVGTGLGVAISTMGPESNSQTNQGTDIKAGDRIVNSNIEVTSDKDFYGDTFRITEKPSLKDKSVSYTLNMKSIENIGADFGAEPDKVQWKQIGDSQHAETFQYLPSLNSPAYTKVFLPSQLIVTCTLDLYQGTYENDNFDLSEYLNVKYYDSVTEEYKALTFTSAAGDTVKSNEFSLILNAGLACDEVNGEHTILTNKEYNSQFSSIQRDVLENYNKKQLFNVSDTIGSVTGFLGLVTLEGKRATTTDAKGNVVEADYFDQDRIVKLYRFLHDSKNKVNEKISQLRLNVEKISLKYYYGDYKDTSKQPFKTLEEFKTAPSTMTYTNDILIKGETGYAKGDPNFQED